MIWLYDFGYGPHNAEVWFMSGWYTPDKQAHDYRYWWQETLGL